MSFMVTFALMSGLVPVMAVTAMWMLMTMPELGLPVEEVRYFLALRTSAQFQLLTFRFTRLRPARARRFAENSAAGQTFGPVPR